MPDDFLFKFRETAALISGADAINSSEFKTIEVTVTINPRATSNAIIPIFIIV